MQAVSPETLGLRVIPDLERPVSPETQQVNPQALKDTVGGFFAGIDFTTPGRHIRGQTTVTIKEGRLRLRGLDCCITVARAKVCNTPHAEVVLVSPRRGPARTRYTLSGCDDSDTVGYDKGRLVSMSVEECDGVFSPVSFDPSWYVEKSTPEEKIEFARSMGVRT
jgi:hypothetical protein